MSIGYVYTGGVMMKLGSFSFQIRTAAYQELMRKTSYRWAKQELFGRRPTWQYTGLGDDQITLRGVIYPAFRGGFNQIITMRTMAESATPLSMVSGSGAIMGTWVITDIEEGQTTFAGQGKPAKMEFTIILQRYS